MHIDEPDIAVGNEPDSVVDGRSSSTNTPRGTAKSHRINRWVAVELHNFRKHHTNRPSPVNAQELIFSDDRRHRIARHVLFWLTWWVYFLLTYYYPTFQYVGWDLSVLNTLVAQYGLAYFFMKTLFINTLLAVVLPQALFTYCIISFALPRYLRKDGNAVKTTLLFLGLMAFIYMAAIGLMYIPFYHNFRIGTLGSIPPLREAIPFVNRTYMFNLPVVGGFAVMIKLTKRSMLKQRETEQLSRENAVAKLQLLRAQIHPHFLFNTLNNIYYFTLISSPKSTEMIRKLISMLQYILNESTEPMVPLEKEVNMLEDYLELERVRYGDKLTLTSDITEKGGSLLISPLLLLPFVENTFKHGASKMTDNAWIKVRISTEGGRLFFHLSNGMPPGNGTMRTRGGIGLANVRKRLALLYPDSHELEISSDTNIYTVQLNIRLQENPAMDSRPGLKSKPLSHGIA
jgi:two-component system LytT family sensor kinase